MAKIGKWENFKEGNFNTVYVRECIENNGKKIKEVLKIAKRTEKEKPLSLADTPERSVRLWNLLNSKYGEAYLVNDKTYGSGWVCPFIESIARKPKDKEIAQVVIKIFNQAAGRIVLDAYCKGNVLITPGGDAVCVDVGFAFSFARENCKRRRYSLVSAVLWKHMAETYSQHFAKYGSSFPKTIDTIKALLFMQATLAEVIDASFLLKNKSLRKELATAYETFIDAKTNAVQVPIPQIFQLTELMEKVQSMSKAESNQPCSSVESLGGTTETNSSQLSTCRQSDVEEELLSNKERCIAELQNYIDKRGKMQADIFFPNMTTVLFRKRNLYVKKVSAALQLQKKIQDAGHSEEIVQLLKASLKDGDLTAAFRYSDFQQSLYNCLLLVGDEVEWQKKKAFCCR